MKTSIIKSDQRAISFRIPALGSTEPIDLKSLSGKTVLLRFWATWCTVCQTENYSLKKLYEEFNSQDFEIVSVSVDKSPGLVHQYAERNKVPFQIGIDPSQLVQTKYNAGSLPQTFLISPEGYLLFFPDPQSAELIDRAVGARDWSDPIFVEALRMYLSQESLR